MENQYLTRAEHSEYVKRMEAHHERFADRFDAIEEDVKEVRAEVVELRKIGASIEKMTTTQTHILEELKDQGQRCRKSRTDRSASPLSTWRLALTGMRNGSAGRKPGPKRLRKHPARAAGKSSGLLWPHCCPHWAAL